MSQWVNDDGVQITGKGRFDRRFAKGNARAATEPKRHPGGVSINVVNRDPHLVKMDEQEFEVPPIPLYISVDDLFDLADTLDALCEYIEKSDYGQ